MLPALLSVVLVAAGSAGAQDTPATPLWFLQSQAADLKFSVRSNNCKSLLADNVDTASFGPIFIPEDEPADICIRFPARDDRPETWRHDRGSRGDCANGCCEFKPPLRNPPPPKEQPTWFETKSDCSDTSRAFNGPTLFKGEEADPKNICFQLEDGSFELQEGLLGNCGGSCCIFYKAPEQ